MKPLNIKLRLKDRYPVAAYKPMLVLTCLLIGVIGPFKPAIAAGDIIGFVRANKAVLENIKAVDEKALLYTETIAPNLENTTDPAQKAVGMSSPVLPPVTIVKIVRERLPRFSPHAT